MQIIGPGSQGESDFTIVPPEMAAYGWTVGDIFEISNLNLKAITKISWTGTGWITNSSWCKMPEQ